MLLLRPLRFVAIWSLFALASVNVKAADTPTGAAPDQAQAAPSPRRVAPASEDSVIANFHSLGKIDGQGPVYRCVCPVEKVADGMKTNEPTPEELRAAIQQMQHLHDLGVRTVVSLQMQEMPSEKKANPEYKAVVLEEAAAKAAGIKYVGFSMANHGKNSLQDMDDKEVAKLVESVSDEIMSDARNGGVAFHCKSGKDRTGLIAAYLRMKYQHWTLEDAVAEMRGYGHVWQKFSRPGTTSSWHEQHLQAISKEIAADGTRR